MAFDVSGFEQNSKFMKRVLEKIDALKSANRKNKVNFHLEISSDDFLSIFIII